MTEDGLNPIDGPVMVELRALADEAVAAIESHFGRLSSETSLA
jgi:hypothetical protein